MIKEDLDEVRRQAQIALIIYRDNNYQIGELLCLDTLAMAERLRRNISFARHHLIEALRIATKRLELGNITVGMPTSALLLTDYGEVEQAVELYEVALHCPYKANSQWFEDVYGQKIAAIAETLPPGVAEAARQRGRERDPWETAKELLAELEAEETPV